MVKSLVKKLLRVGRKDKNPTPEAGPSTPGYCWMDHVQNQDLGPYPSLERVLQCNPTSVAEMVEKKTHFRRRKTLKQLWRNWTCEGLCEWRDGCTCYEPPLEKNLGMSTRWRDGVEMACQVSEARPLPLHVVVGSAAEMIAESKRVQAVEFAKVRALDEFNADVASMPTTPYRMPANKLAELARYLGYTTSSLQQRHNTSDHLFLQISRDHCRIRLEQLFPHNTDAFTVLHHGSTMQEIRAWYSHSGHHFEIAAAESADESRIYMDAVRWVTSRVDRKILPALQTRKPAAIHMKFKTLEELLLFGEGGGTKRIHYQHPPLNFFDVGFWEDCLYKMSETQFVDEWRRHKHRLGYAVLFAPDFLLGQQCVPSEIYDYEKYLPGSDVCAKAFDAIWPQILVLSPTLPLSDLAGAVHAVLKWCVTNGYDFFKRKVELALSSPFPFELILGLGFDAMKMSPILSRLLDELVPFLYDELCRVRIWYKGGTSNGYDESYSRWKRWVFQRRIDAGDFCIDSEIVHRVGEMVIIKYWRSNGQTPIVSTIEVPTNRRAMMLADIETAWDRHNKCLTTPNYFPANETDVYKLFNWAMDQPIESLSLAVVSTTLNRIRGGLSTGSRVLVEPMAVDERTVTKISLAVLMEVYNRRQVLTEIENDPDLRDNYDLNIKRLMSTLATSATILISGGLAIPAYYLYKWLTTSNRRFDFFRPYVAPKVNLFAAQKKEKAFEGVETRIVFEESELGVEPSGCLLCDLQATGLFSKTGRAQDGQRFVCGNHANSKERDNSFTAEQATETFLAFRDAKNRHEQMGARKVVEQIRKVEHFFETNMGGINHKVSIDVLKGGPGTGKSVIIRALALYLTENGHNVEVMVPFSDLVEDYVNCDVVGRTGKFNFQVDTTYYASKNSNCSYLIVDEATAMDVNVVRSTALYIGATNIVLAGDPKQTCLNEQAGEGTHCMSDKAFWEFDTLPYHELVYNYRMDAWRTKCWNFVYGYNMIAKRTDEIPPKLMTKAEYEASKPQLQIQRELVFAHASAMPVFGVQSQAGENTVENMSVRSAQGKTFKNVAVSASEHDRGLLIVNGMINVAGSRATHQVVFVAPESVDDDVPKEIAETLYFSTQEKIDFISALSWPVIQEPQSSVRLSHKQKAMDQQIAKKRQEETCWIEEEREWVEKYESVPMKANELRPLTLVDTFWDLFNTCLLDPIVKLRPDLKPEFAKWLQIVYEDDDWMGRRDSVLGKFARVLRSGNKPLPKIDGKWHLPTMETIQYIEKLQVPIVVYSDGARNPFYVHPYILEAGKQKPLVTLVIKDGHATEVQPKPVLVKFPDVKANVEWELFEPLPNGKMPIAYTPVKGVRTVDCQLLKTTSRDVATVDINDYLNKVEEAMANDEAPRATANPAPSNYVPKKPSLRERRENKAKDPLERAADFRRPATDAEREDAMRAFEPGETVDQIMQRRIDQTTAACVEPPPFVGPRKKFELPTFERKIEALRADALLTQAYLLERNYVEVVGGLLRMKPDRDWSYDAQCTATRWMPASGAWKSDPKQDHEVPIHDRTKYRHGTDLYLAHEFVDKSAAWTKSGAINSDAPYLGQTQLTNVKLNWEGFLWTKTKAGKLREHKKRDWLQIHPGEANHFSDSPVETLVAGQRYGRIVHKPRLNQETKAYAQRVVDRAFREVWDEHKPVDELEINFIIDTALSAAHQRNYHGRANALKNKWVNSTTFSGKVQTKPIKNGKLNLWKGGQGLMQTPPDFNLEWIAFARVVNFFLKAKARDNCFMDDRESEGHFRERVTRAVREMPKAARFAIIDAETFDSQQNEVTVYLEKLIMLRMGFTELAVDEFQRFRRNCKFVSPGLFQGVTNGDKGSGFLDTKSMNTALELCCLRMLLSNVGEDIHGGKGDDAFKMAVGLQVDVQEQKNLKAYLGMVQTVDIGDGCEYTGNTITRDGMYPSITRTAMKAICAHVRNKSHFEELQQSWRDKVKEWRVSGWHQTIAYSADAEGASYSYVDLCAGFVESLGHLKWGQYLSIAQKYRTVLPNLPDAFGPQIL